MRDMRRKYRVGKIIRSRGFHKFVIFGIILIRLHDRIRFMSGGASELLLTR